MLAILAAVILAPATRLRINKSHVLNTIRPDEALGAGIDGHEEGSLDVTFRPHNLAAMDSAGLRPLTYRLRTELAIEAWHWNPEGTWSDPAHHQGYFVGNPTPAKPILKSYGYRLPRRGNTTDQANDDGYSRMTDGDDRTFWKSNPYLDAVFTKTANDKVPQWVVVDLGDPQTVDQLRLHWAAPFATRYSLEFWTGEDAINLSDDELGHWEPLAGGRIRDGKGGVESRRFAARRFRFLRVVLLEHSGTSLTPSTDVRDRVGFAIREIELGTTDRSGKFHDLLHHSPNNHKQSFILTSSTDPWHRESDRDPKTEQPGFDRVAGSILAHDLPILFPTSILYDNPETALNEVSWLVSRGIKIRGIEMGEEPDGQFDTPEHFAQLYAQVYRRLRANHPHLLIGGPGLQTVATDVYCWPDAKGNRSYISHLLAALKKEGTPLGFFSFEWYPYDDVVGDPYPKLRGAASFLDRFLTRQEKVGLTHDIPWMITEYGYSAYSAPAEVDLPGGLLNADVVGIFLARGGNAAYLYGYEPNELIAEKANAWGNLMILQEDEDGNAKWKLPAYWTAWLMTHVWTLPGHAEHQMLAVQGLAEDSDLSAYAMRRPDGKIAVLLLNKNPHLARAVDFGGARLQRLFRYGRDQFVWHADGAKGHPTRSLPPAESTPRQGPVMLAPSSINVLVIDEKQ